MKLSQEGKIFARPGINILKIDIWEFTFFFSCLSTRERDAKKIVQLEILVQKIRMNDNDINAKMNLKM